MTNFGFKKSAGEPDQKGRGMDLSGLPSGAVPLDPMREKAAVERGEALGFKNRGEGPSASSGRGARRKKPAPPPTQTLYIRAPEDLAEWFQSYTEAQGHRALWHSIQDFRDLVEGRGT